MVKVEGFPRPLYPPDAAQRGKQPSVDGPDVVAYKRTVSRAGRWPWEQFDAGYGDDFAHGSGGDVGESGVAGVQLQQHLDATGWIGQQTFNTFRSIRVPDGLPHAGEPAMDGQAVELINEAWAMFGGHEPTAGAGSVRQAALDRLSGELGNAESPAGSNDQKYGEWYGMNGVPWCAIFQTWGRVLGAQDVGATEKSFIQGSRYSYVPYIVGDARANRYGLSTTDDPIPGDLVCYDWDGNGEFDHVGIFERWTSGTSQFDAIEGNTSAGNNSNGGEVMRRSRARTGQVTVFVRVAEP
jgi:hypothetical protein